MSSDNKPAAPFPWKFNADQTLVTIGPLEKPAELNAASLEVVALWLGDVRSKMRPPVASSPHLAAQLAPLVRFAVDPKTPDPPVETGCRILVSSPHFGWFSLELSAKGCQGLVQSLLEKPAASSLPLVN